VGAEGAAFVFLGSATGIADGSPTTAAAQLESDQAGAELGIGVGGAGDVNGDGYADVIAGAPFYEAGTGETNEGAAFVFLGSATGIAGGDPSSASAQLESNQAGAGLGYSVAGAGDVNGDGYADVIVGADLYDAGQTNEGAAFVFLGGASGIADGNPTTAAAQLESDQASAFLGQSVAGAGDVNGDGYADVIVGTFLYDAGQMDEGAAFVFLGNSEGRPVLARQRRGDGSGVPVQSWGVSRHATDFAAELRASHPEGPARVRAEFEACPPALPFGDAGCTNATSPSWVELTAEAPEALLSHTFVDLATGAPYRWRARVLHAPVTGPIPANPAHGPWRRVSGQADEADLRIGFHPECNDGLDNDGDGRIDHGPDPGCAYLAEASERSPALVCDNGIDDDGDTATDYPADPGCRDPEWGTENPACNDGIDNDGDTLTDMADSDCVDPWSDGEIHLECDDDLDNDGDGRIDYPADLGCRNPEWGTESPGCNDGVDNDGDALIDMADPDCGNPWSDNEIPGGCGLLGIEVLPLLVWSAARRRRSLRRDAYPAPGRSPTIGS
jgi:hypothetical protein